MLKITENEILEAYDAFELSESELIELYSEGYISENTMDQLIEMGVFDEFLYEQEELEESKNDLIHGIKNKLYSTRGKAFAKASGALSKLAAKLNSDRLMKTSANMQRRAHHDAYRTIKNASSYANTKNTPLEIKDNINKIKSNIIKNSSNFKTKMRNLGYIK